MGSYFKAGTYNVICDLCGRQFKSDEVRKRWDGLIVCVHDYETRHILDFIKTRPENTTVPYVRKEPDDAFVWVCQFPQTLALADVGVADCTITGFNTGLNFSMGNTNPIAGVAVAGRTYTAKDNTL